MDMGVYEVPARFGILEMSIALKLIHVQVVSIVLSPPFWLKRFDMTSCWCDMYTS